MESDIKFISYVVMILSVILILAAMPTEKEGAIYRARTGHKTVYAPLVERALDAQHTDRTHWRRCHQAYYDTLDNDLKCCYLGQQTLKNVIHNAKLPFFYEKSTIKRLFY